MEGIFSFDKFIVLDLCLLGIFFTYWFFLMKKSTVFDAKSDEVDIVVEGGYQPDVIKIKHGQTTKLNFLRKDSSSCLEEVVLWDFKIRRKLPLNEKVVIVLRPEKKGEFTFTCGMNMFHGKLLVS